MSKGIFYNTALMFFSPRGNYMLMGLKSVSYLFGALQSQDAGNPETLAKVIQARDFKKRPVSQY